MSLSIRRILVPVDFSETSDKAFDYAISVARVFNADVTALHVLEDPILYAPTTDPSFRESLERTMHSKLDSLLEARGIEGVNVVSELVAGTPFYEILKHAREGKYDMIVIGTHGRGLVQHMLMGSVAEKVVRQSACPVLSVRLDGHQFVNP